MIMIKRIRKWIFNEIMRDYINDIHVDIRMLRSGIEVCCKRIAKLEKYSGETEWLYSLHNSEEYKEYQKGLNKRANALSRLIVIGNPPKSDPYGDALYKNWLTNGTPECNETIESQDKSATSPRAGDKKSGKNLTEV